MTATTELTLSAALAAIKPLLTDSLAIYSGLVAYHDGVLRAYDGVNSIHVTLPGLPPSWCVDGAKLAAMVKPDSKLDRDEQHLLIANGRSRFKLYSHEQELVPPEVTHDGDLTPISAEDWKVLKLAATFRSPHAVYPWAACIYVRNHRAYVTNNIVAAVFDIGLDTDGMIPAIAVESLASAQGVFIGPHYIVFARDALSLRCALPEVEPPNVFFTKCDEIEEAVMPIAEGLLEAFESTITIDPRAVTINSREVKATSTKGDSVVVDIETKSDVEGIYDPRFIIPALKIASHVDWDCYPKPVIFKGPGVRGMIAGRTY